MAKIRTVSILIPIFVLAVFAVSCGGSGGGSAADPAQQEFLTQLTGRAQKTSQDMEEAESLAKKLNQIGRSTKPLSATGIVAMDGAEPKPGEIEAALNSLTQVETRLKEQAALAPLEAPGDCADCAGKVETLKKGIADTLTQIATIRSSFNNGQQIVKIRDEEVKKLEQQLPKLEEMDTEEEFLEEYRIQERIYGETLAQWQALTVPASSQAALQKVIAAEQALIDLHRSLAAAGLSTVTSVEMERGESVIKAENEESKAISELYETTLKALDEGKDNISAAKEGIGGLA